MHGGPERVHDLARRCSDKSAAMGSIVPSLNASEASAMRAAHSGGEDARNGNRAFSVYFAGLSAIPWARRANLAPTLWRQARSSDVRCSPRLANRRTAVLLVIEGGCDRLRLDRAAQSWVEQIADAVAEEVEGEHGDGNGEPGKEHQPPRRHQTGVQGIGEHIAP